jgi:hypothetical protein
MHVFRIPQERGLTDDIVEKAADLEAHKQLDNNTPNASGQWLPSCGEGPRVDCAACGRTRGAGVHEEDCARRQLNPQQPRNSKALKPPARVEEGFFSLGSMCVSPNRFADFTDSSTSGATGDHPTLRMPNETDASTLVVSRKHAEKPTPSLTPTFRFSHLRESAFQRKFRFGALPGCWSIAPIGGPPTRISLRPAVQALASSHRGLRGLFAPCVLQQ